jgi:OmpA-OmpF porin, OOP family
MKHFLLILGLVLSAQHMQVMAQANAANDGDWTAQRVTLPNTPEAEYMYRVGDVDNLGFGFEEGFDPFCGSTTEPHAYPWEAAEGDLPGLDRILLSSRFDPAREQPCSSDGYVGSYDSIRSQPQPITFELPELKGKAIQNASLQVMLDDFQSPSFCSRFQVTLNGERFVEAERLLAAIEQGGPVGKLITLAIPEQFHPALQSGSLSLLIDESTGAGDGFAIDFVKLLVNRRATIACTGSAQGFVYDLVTHEPIVDAAVNSSFGKSQLSEVTGYFHLKELPTGMVVLAASAPGYQEGYGTADVAVGEDNEPITIYLMPERRRVDFDGQAIGAGQAIRLDKILFAQGSAQLQPASQTELDKLAAFLQAQPQAEIELTGHTSSEGEPAANRSLSYRRVKACKDYLVAQGIDTGRVTTMGLGADRPVASDDTEEGRVQNRRVELRVLRL